MVLALVLITGLFVLSWLAAFILICFASFYAFPIRNYIIKNQDNVRFRSLIDWLYGSPIRFVKYIYMDHELDSKTVIISKRKLKKILKMLCYVSVALLLSGIGLFILSTMFS